MGKSSYNKHMETSIIDSHTHVYPQLSYHLEHQHRFQNLSNEKIVEMTRFIEDRVQPLKFRLAEFSSPIQKILHHSSILVRNLPAPLKKLSEITGMPWMGLMGLLECNTEDLMHQMGINGVTRTVVIAHPPFTPNEFVLKLAAKNERIIPVVNLFGIDNPAEKLLEYISQGAKALKIHPASDGKGSDFKIYLQLLEIANQHALPVIIHTGCLHIKPIYKNPEMGHAKLFEPWFKSFPNINFVLAHMNFHYPDQAITLAGRYENVFLETSWQPEKTIAKATTKLGPDKIMYGSDWPIMGGNMTSALGRIRNLHRDRIISDSDYEKITNQTARRIFEEGKCGQ